ncbi:Urease accessory protein UreD [Sulfitobacter noctilucae]|nr:Urease accessory protein UreD [Sulfitobacter noctilucae]
MRQAGSLKLVFPRPATHALDAVIVNTAGGVTGGDRFSLTATAQAGTALHLTTQAAERAYRAEPGEPGRITTRLAAEAGASVHWLPQETILFQGANLERRLSVDLAADARLLLCEPLVFGRRAMGETLNTARFNDRIEVRRNGQLHVLDATRMSGDIAAHLARRDIANGAAALAFVLYIAPDAEAHLAPVRALLGPNSGASLLHPDTLVIRALAEDSFVLRQSLIPVLTQLSGGPLPRPWMI